MWSADITRQDDNKMNKATTAKRKEKDKGGKKDR